MYKSLLSFCFIQIYICGIFLIFANGLPAPLKTSSAIHEFKKQKINIDNETTTRLCLPSPDTALINYKNCTSSIKDTKSSEIETIVNKEYTKIPKLYGINNSKDKYATLSATISSASPSISSSPSSSPLSSSTDNIENKNDNKVEFSIVGNSAINNSKVLASITTNITHKIQNADFVFPDDEYFLNNDDDKISNTAIASIVG